MGWLNDLAGPNFAPAVLWTLLALVVLVIVLIIIRIVRSMTFGTFVAGGRNRKTRLAVMDAAAVDSQRRLVLVRRDDVEHLILIGGPTDVVVERDIRLHSPARRAASVEPAPDGQPRPRAAEVPAQPRIEQRRPATPPAKPEQPAQQPPHRSPPPPPAPAPVATVAKPVPVRMPATRPSAPATEANFSISRPSQPANNPPPAAPRLKPLDNGKTPVSEPNSGDVAKKKLPELTLEDEMNRLLGELSNKK